ncbi:MAG: hypothetical protein HUK28_06145 [Methanobrevibacter sp.]|nr:hypothetical protein [Methanobrevibacter sp.]
MKDMYITITAIHKFGGEKPFRVRNLLKLVKDKNNDHDDEAIAVEMRFAGKVGYVANSTKTVIRGTMSAGRVYDKLTDEDYAEVKFYSNGFVIAKILTSEEIDELRKDKDNDINFLSDTSNNNI